MKKGSDGKDAEKIICGELRAGTVTDEQWEQIWRKKAGEVRNDNPSLHGQTKTEKLFGRAIERIRDIIAANFSGYLEELRGWQIEKNPDNPNNKFALYLLSGIREEIEELGMSFDTDEYDLRFYTAVDSVGDRSSGMDCWVELVEKQEDGSVVVIDTFIIDVSARGSKPRNDKEKLTDDVFYYDFEDVLTEVGDNNVTDRMIDSTEFEDLLVEAADKFAGSLRQARLTRPRRAIKRQRPKPDAADIGYEKHKEKE